MNRRELGPDFAEWADEIETWEREKRDRALIRYADPTRRKPPVESTWWFNATACAVAFGILFAGSLYALGVI